MVVVLWAIVTIVIVPFYMFSQRARSCGRSGCGLLRLANVCKRHARSDEALRRASGRGVPVLSGIRERVSAHVSNRRVRRNGDEALERTDKVHTAAAGGGDGTAFADTRHPRNPVDAAAVARRGLPSRSRDRVSRGTAAVE